MVIVWHITSNAMRLVQQHLHQSPSTLRRLNLTVCPVWFYAIYCVLCRSPQLLFALCYFVRSDLEWQYYDWWSIRLKYSGSTIINYIFSLVLNLFILIQFFFIHVSLKSLYLVILHFRYVSFTCISCFIQTVSSLSDGDQDRRVEFCDHGELDIDRILWSDEAIFTLN